MRFNHIFITAVITMTLSALLSNASADQPATPTGPVPGTRMTEAYVQQVARSAHAWGWPMLNIHSRYQASTKIPALGLAGGIIPVAPTNYLCMLTDYIDPFERAVACPNQDVVYGQCVIDFSQEPVVVQVPDFGDRFWVYQVVDQRTDSFGALGKMYGTKPGFYLLAGQDWDGEIPEGITEVFRCSTRLGCLFPRVFQSDDTEDKQAVQPILSKINAYPLSKYDGKVKEVDWSKLPEFPGVSGDSEVKWVVPEDVVNVLPLVLNEVPPLPGEEAMYAQFRSVLEAVQNDPQLKEAFIKASIETEQNIVLPLFQFRNYGIPLPGNWTTQLNGAEFGTDYYTRLAVAKSNIFVNRAVETRYFYQDLDADGERLNSSQKYTLTFPKGQHPPVKGVWSLTLYNKHHFFAPNDLHRYSLGTKNKDLKLNDDGSLTLYVQAEPPADALRSNWLPAPNDEFSLYVRCYWPEDAVLKGEWTPPAVKRTEK